MKKRKLKLDTLRLESFKTSVGKIKGGNLTFYPNCKPTEQCPGTDDPRDCVSCGDPGSNCFNE